LLDYNYIVVPLLTGFYVNAYLNGEGVLLFLTGDLENKRSTTGFVFMMRGGVISWSNELQPTIALSTTEAEYMVNTQGTKEAIWIQN
jgi:hypothetical protein